MKQTYVFLRMNSDLAQPRNNPHANTSNMDISYLLLPINKEPGKTTTNSIECCHGYQKIQVITYNAVTRIKKYRSQHYYLFFSVHAITGLALEFGRKKAIPPQESLFF